MTRQGEDEAHIDLDVEVLEVESVLPDIDTDEGNVAQERVLVSCGYNLERLVGQVQALENYTRTR
jgi:hypothetical protein